jgi:uncharacterized protein
MNTTPSLRIGLISDTHGLLRPQACAALAGVAHILHAGDIGKAEVLEQLEKIAPVSAIRGNNDIAAWAAAIPETLTIELGGVRIHMLHDVKELALDPVAERIGLVIAGHSHKPSVHGRNDVLFVNPGSAGPRRFSLPVSVALLDIAGGVPHAEIRVLDLD